ncbi:NAD(P)H-hydrate dehydratase [Siminovitchia sediminis]|uniref:Bifunctional NAD(P)H-hydrate repair enzyme n=1 Tax=Siminovitchia sediminis TaxID=1274353 RepID=A0ABW4KG04_9BACI
MYAAGQQEMKQMDQYTIDTLGLPGVVLMENAGAAVVKEITEAFPSPHTNIIVLAGSGNNAGDGFVVARRLHDAGYKCKLYMVADPHRLKGDAKIHYEAYRNRQLPVCFYHEELRDKFINHLKLSDAIIDAMLGTGVKGPVRQPMADMISIVNRMNKPVISVDIPSGLNSDTGKAENEAIKADQTITFVCPKIGFFLQDGPKYIGEWKVEDISVPLSIANQLGLRLPVVITEKLMRKFIPKRPADGHKGTFGHVLVLGGSRPYVGAPIFTAKSSILSGAGLVTLGIPENVYPMAAAQASEALLLPLPAINGHFSNRALDELSASIGQFDVIAIGPGMGKFPEGENWIKRFYRMLTGQTVIVDADALHLSRNHLELLKQYKGDVIFTPHPGEMANLLNCTVKEVEEDRLGTATSFSKEHGIYLLLKGHRSIIATPKGEVLINPSGNDALGKGGSGDVLTGLIASLTGQGATATEAMAAASYIHARAGEEKAKQLSKYGVTAPDIMEGVREILAEPY